MRWADHITPQLCARPLGTPCPSRKAARFDRVASARSGRMSLRGEGQRNELRLSDYPIAGKQGNVMHGAGRRNDPVGRVGAEIEADRGRCDADVDGPDVQSGECASDLAVVEGHLQPPELDQLCKLPQHDGRNRPAVPLQQGALGRPKPAGERENEDVGVKIQVRLPVRGPC